MQRRVQGFLLLAALALIIIIGLLSAVAVHLMTTNSRAAGDELSAAQAYYLAYSGIEIAKHSLASGVVSCNDGSYNNLTFSNAPGVFNLTATSTTSIVTTLKTALTATSTSIAVTDASQFTAPGYVLVDNEIIAYKAINKTTGVLSTLTRASNNTLAAAHAIGAAVVQNQCVVTATAGVPVLTTTTTSSGTIAPRGRRVLQQTLFTTGVFSLGNNSSNGAPVTPALTQLGGVNFSTAIVQNAAVTVNSANFIGSTIVTNGNININLGQTQINSALGIVPSSSLLLGINNDILRNTSLINSSNFFGKFFNQSQSKMQALSNQSYNNSNISGAKGVMIWIDDLNLSGSTTVGTPASPVILIVTNNLNMSGSATVYGFVYSFSNLSLSGSSKIIGAVASEGTINLNNGGIYYNAGVINALNPTYLNLAENVTPLSLQEVF